MKEGELDVTSNLPAQTYVFQLHSLLRFNEAAMSHHMLILKH